MKPCLPDQAADGRVIAQAAHPGRWELRGGVHDSFIVEAMNSHYLTLSRRDNQARGIGQYAIDFLTGKLGRPDEAVLAKVEQFHLDSVGCAVAALATKADAPTLLREEALSYADSKGATCFGSQLLVAPEKAVVANCSAVRELDANGTNFGYNPRTGYQRGEFGHNDF